MTHTVTVTLAALGIVGQVAVLVIVVAAVLAAVGVRGPLRFVRDLIWGYELWLAFVVVVVATLGSLFFSDIADFIPCKLCWFQRIFMYPLALIIPLMALARDNRAARYLLPLPVIGAGVAVYHIMIEEGWVEQARTCLISAPGGCATKWIDEFGYVTIPVLALTGFALTLALLMFAAFRPGDHPHDAPAAGG